MGIVCGPYTESDFRVMALLKRGIRRMENKPLFEDLLKRERSLLKTKYIQRIAA